MAVPNWKDRPTQMELDNYRDDEKLIITWSGGNKGEWTVRKINGINYVYPTNFEKYKDPEYREQMINSSLIYLNDNDVWKVEKESICL